MLLRHLVVGVKRPSGCLTKWYSSRVFVPIEPAISHIDETKVKPAPELNQELVDHLERLSLVRFSNEEAVHHLRKAIHFANRLKLVDTTNVKPMESVLEEMTCPLREDVVNDGNIREQVLCNATNRVEEYFVTPPGNIALEQAPSLDWTNIRDAPDKSTT
uniref:Glutamyl-tRNA(Gln) amidotransferase subunit C, mitochondrial n=1 Tax=Plectus sambesii TaxID=2011161 RepID=A0A914VBA4_9BILA